MSYVIQSLRPRHHLIIQYAFNGLTNIEIAEKTGLSKNTVGCILRSPAAQAELARLASIAVEKSTNIPARVALHHELVGAAIAGLRINKALMQDPFVKAETRSRIGQHFMDRTFFDKRDNDDSEQESYRDILRKIDKLQASVDGSVINGTATIVEERLSNGNSHHDSNDNSQVHEIAKSDVGHPSDAFLSNALDYLLGQNSKHVIDLGEDDS